MDGKKKQSLYFPEEMLREIEAESARHNRSRSWIVQRAWKAARKAIMQIPSVNASPDHHPLLVHDSPPASNVKA